jgi:hypothetical protein
MRPIVGTLLPPNTPPQLPHGLDRGGIFEADYVSPQYIDAERRTIPTDSPMTENVTTDVFMQRIAFRRPDEVRVITKQPMQGCGQLPTVVHPFGQLPTVVYPFGQPPGYARHYTSYQQQHRHYMDLPQQTAMASGHRHGYGQMVQGMGPQAGSRLIGADRPPQAIPGWSPVPRPHEDTKGGIFGRAAVIGGGMATGGSVPGVPTKEIMVERTVQQITGFGGSPDGIG